MSDTEDRHETDLSPEAEKIMDKLVAMAEAGGLQPDPAKIIHTALALMLVTLENDLVCVPRGAAEAAGLNVTRPETMQ